MALQYKKNKNKYIIYIRGELDSEHGEKLIELIKQYSSEFHKIIINMESVSYLNTEGLKGFINAFNLLKGKESLVEKLQENIREIFVKIGLLNKLPYSK
jgi:anti-anti-sigma factor